jgi:hypothetical protein
MGPCASSTKIEQVGETKLKYSVNKFKGDCGSALVFESSGHVIAMHKEQLNDVPANASAKEFKASLSGSTSGVFNTSSGIRMWGFKLI